MSEIEGKVGRRIAHKEAEGRGGVEESSSAGEADCEVWTGGGSPRTFCIFHFSTFLSSTRLDEILPPKVSTRQFVPIVRNDSKFSTVLLHFARIRPHLDLLIRFPRTGSISVVSSRTPLCCPQPP